MSKNHPTVNDPSLFNLLLDDLNLQLHGRNITRPSLDLLDLVRQGCQIVPAENGLLSAKFANFMCAVITKHSITLEKSDLLNVVKWLTNCLADGPDLAYVDLLEALTAVVKPYENFFSDPKCNWSVLVSSLCARLEEKCAVALPNDVLVSRVNCMSVLASCLSSKWLVPLAEAYLDVPYSSQLFNNATGQAESWPIILAALDDLWGRSDFQWNNELLRDSIGVVLAGMDCNGVTVPVRPDITSTVLPPLPVQPAPSPKSKGQEKSKKQKSKTKVKAPSWKEDEISRSDATWNERDVVPADSWPLSSDSELSDSEGSKIVHLNKKQARIRHLSFNLFIRISKAVDSRHLYQYYGLLVPKILNCLQSPMEMVRVRMAAAAALTAFLMNAKQYLSLAQFRDGNRAFTTFSEVLAETMSNVHDVLRHCLYQAHQSSRDGGGNSSSIQVAFLKAAAVLIKVSPYHRLRPSLLMQLLNVVMPFTKTLDSVVKASVLGCLLEIILMSNPIEEVNKVIFKDNWIFQYSLAILEVENEPNLVKSVAWELMSGLVIGHCAPIDNSAIFHLQNLALKRLDADGFNAVKTLKQTLIKMHADVGVEPETKVQVWTRLLEGNSNLVAVMQQGSDKSTAVACDALSYVGSNVFFSLSESLRVFILTLVYGCCASEYSSVRSAGINTLGTYLLFPQMSNEEQYVYDIELILVKALEDPVELVRIKAAWAFGNLVDLFIDNMDNFVDGFSVIKLLQAGLSIKKSSQKALANILRSLGRLLFLVKEENLDASEFKNAVDKAVNLLVWCASSGMLMKMRWNACQALATVLSNPDIYLFINNYTITIIENLSSLLIKCNNFKVRIKAAVALQSIQLRNHFGDAFWCSWSALLEGLENAANMPDFSEFKHQDSLVHQLCDTICHMTTLVSHDDLVQLKLIMDYRMETLYFHMRQYQESAPPDRTSALLGASCHLRDLNTNFPSQLSSKEADFLARFTLIFQVDAL